MCRLDSRKADGKLYVNAWVWLTNRPPSQVAGQHPSTHISVKTEDSRAAGPTLAALFTPSSHVGVNTRRHGGFVSLVRGRSHIEILSESCFHFHFSLSYLLSIWSLSGAVLGKGAPPSVMALLCFLSHSFLLGLILSPLPFVFCLPELCGNLSLTDGSSPVLFIVAELHFLFISS